MVALSTSAENAQEDRLFLQWCKSAKKDMPGSGAGGRLRRIVRDAYETIARVDSLDELHYDSDVLVDSLVFASVDLNALRRESWFDSTKITEDTGVEADVFWRGAGSVIIDWDDGRFIPFRVNMYGNSKSVVRRHFQTYAFRLIRWFHVMMRNRPVSSKAGKGVTGKNPCFDDFTFHWFLLDVPKRLDMALGDGSRTITSRMVNSGYTWRCAPNGVVVIYRLEDAFKVFIHETIHTFGYDKAMLSSTSPTGKGVAVVNGYDVDLNEVCCEFFARIYSVVESLCDRKIDARRERQMMASLEFEAWWGIYQADKLIRVASGDAYTLLDVLADDGVGVARSALGYLERTPAISYYVVVGVMLYEFYYGDLGRRRVSFGRSLLEELMVLVDGLFKNGGVASASGAALRRLREGEHGAIRAMGMRMMHQIEQT